MITGSGPEPPPPPEANLAYKKSGEESGGVIAMIDLLVADIDKEHQVMISVSVGHSRSG